MIYIHCNFWKPEKGYIGNDRGCWNCYYRFISICMLPLLNPEIDEVEVRFGDKVVRKVNLEVNVR